MFVSWHIAEFHLKLLPKTELCNIKIFILATNIFDHSRRQDARSCVFSLVFLFFLKKKKAPSNRGNSQERSELKVSWVLAQGIPVQARGYLYSSSTQWNWDVEYPENLVDLRALNFQKNESYPNFTFLGIIFRRSYGTTLSEYNSIY